MEPAGSKHGLQSRGLAVSRLCLFFTGPLQAYNGAYIQGLLLGALCTRHMVNTQRQLTTIMSIIISIFTVYPGLTVHRGVIGLKTRNLCNYTSAQVLAILRRRDYGQKYHNLSIEKLSGCNPQRTAKSIQQTLYCKPTMCWHSILIQELFSIFWAY